MDQAGLRVQVMENVYGYWFWRVIDADGMVHEKATTGVGTEGEARKTGAEALRVLTHDGAWRD